MTFMFKAVCHSCGDFKTGILQPCKSCGSRVGLNQSRIRLALAYSTYQKTDDELLAVSKNISSWDSAKAAKARFADASPKQRKDHLAAAYAAHNEDMRSIQALDCVCSGCGSRLRGLFTTCEACGCARRQEPEPAVRGLELSSRFLSDDELANISAELMAMPAAQKAIADHNWVKSQQTQQLVIIVHRAAWIAILSAICICFAVYRNEILELINQHKEESVEPMTWARLLRWSVYVAIAFIANLYADFAERNMLTTHRFLKQQHNGAIGAGSAAFAVLILLYVFSLYSFALAATMSVIGFVLASGLMRVFRSYSQLFCSLVLFALVPEGAVRALIDAIGYR
jgi:hypothetical protein